MGASGFPQQPDEYFRTTVGLVSVLLDIGSILFGVLIRFPPLPLFVFPVLQHRRLDEAPKTNRAHETRLCATRYSDRHCYRCWPAWDLSSAVAVLHTPLGLRPRPGGETKRRHGPLSSIPAHLVQFAFVAYSLLSGRTAKESVALPPPPETRGWHHGFLPISFAQSQEDGVSSLP